MRTPTPEQQDVLDSTARVRIVRAAPGSGKTWLVAELIRRELGSWTSDGRGIAALSFTRVGGEEIRKALGYDLDHPHFVGTIDSFLFRYVVRPFLPRARPNHAPPRLIPADWAPGHWTRRPDGAPWVYRGSGGAHAQIYNLFDTCYIDEDSSGPVLARPRPYHGGVEAIPSGDRAGLLAAKRQVWQRMGWVTHADAAFIASELLGDVTCGATIRSVLLRRFPLLAVDELQDTGFFLGKSIRLLLGESDARGVLVGDPDQAIFEFNGARPDLFTGFESLDGARVLPLARSQRCPASITACASYLKDSAGQFDPAEGDVGRAFLVRYSNMVPDVQRLVGSIRSAHPRAGIKLVARQVATIEELTSRSAREPGSLYCPALNHTFRAVRAFRQGHNVKALAAASAALDVARFGHEGITDEELAGQSIAPKEWKALAIRCLLNWNDLAATQSIYDWQTAAGEVIDAQVLALGHPYSLDYQPGTLKPQKRSGWDRTAGDFLPTGFATISALAGAPVQTVHSVKGETHDLSIFVCPDPSPQSRCPSVVWWSTDAALREERRIAYVAMTRTRSDLVLCVSEASFQRLCNDRPSFVATFQCKTVDECIAEFADTLTALCPSGAGA